MKKFGETYWTCTKCNIHQGEYKCPKCGRTKAKQKWLPQQKIKEEVSEKPRCSNCIMDGDCREFNKAPGADGCFDWWSK